MQRTVIVVAGCLGLSALLVLVLVKGGLTRASQSGPRWLKPFLTASLILLAWLGVAQAKEVNVESPGTKPMMEEQQKDILEKTPEGRQILAAIKQMKVLKENARNAEVDAARQALQQAEANLGKLIQRGVLDPAQGALLTWRLNQCHEDMRGLTTECYKVQYFSPARTSLKKLQARLPYLQQMARSQTLEPQALEQVLTTLQDDVDVLAQEKLDPKEMLLTPQEYQQGQKDLKEVKQLIQTLRDKAQRP